MPKTKTSNNLVKVGKLKFDKTLLAVTALVVVVTGGYIFYKGTHAATVAGWTGLLKQYNCPYNSSYIPPTIQPGSQGGCVKFLQFLIWTENLRYGQPLISINGIFDSTTARYVLSFKQKNGLNSDSVVGPTAWQKLNSCINDKASSPYTTWACSKL